MTTATTLAQQLATIGAISFGQFRVGERFLPFSLHLALVPSYPPIWEALAEVAARLLAATGKRFVLPTPTAIPLGAAAALRARLPLAFPTEGANGPIEGAFDYNVPTVLFTDSLTDGAVEETLIRNAARQGLEVEAVIALIDVGQRPLRSGHLRPVAWHTLASLVADLDVTLIPSAMRRAIAAWQQAQG